MADNKQPPQPSQSTLPPASAPFPGSRTPGWNDPPTLKFNPNVAGSNALAAGRTPRLLNKRVAFPLQNTDTNINAAAKPTAIVPPNQASIGSGAGLPPPMSLPPAVAAAAGAVHPIAVVHPMRNMNAPPLASAIATPFVPTFAVDSGAAGAVANTTTAVSATTTTTLTATAITERSLNAAPRIFVPPHQEESSSRPAAAVQHI